jgi:ComF family protein
MLPLFLRAVFEVFGAALAPDRCAACETNVPMLTAFCRSCAATLVPARPVDPHNVAPFLYGGALARALVRFKYESHPELARPLSSALRRAARLLPAPPDVVVPVPLYPARLVERGFNQAALLARPVAADLGVLFAPRALKRTRDTGQQAKLDRGGRAMNVAGAFAVAAVGQVIGKHVLVVDDVRTTGATLVECSRALRGAGARLVTTLVVARADVDAAIQP